MLYNNQDSESIAITDYYRQARNIPSENLLSLNIPSSWTDLIDNHEIQVVLFNEVIWDADGNTNEDPNTIYPSVMRYIFCRREICEIS